MASPSSRAEEEASREALRRGRHSHHPGRPRPGGGPPAPPGIAAATCPGPAANMVCGLLCAVADLRSTFAASMRSAGVPCRSPLVSFLNAYITLTARLHRNCPFIASIAASDASDES